MDKRFGLDKECLEDIIAVLKLQPDVDEAIIFGSRAIGNYKTGSDIDIALKGPQLSFDDVSDISLNLDALGYAYTYDVINYHRISNPAVTAHIDELGIVFFKKESAPPNWKTYEFKDFAELRKEQVVPNGKEQPYIGLEHIEQQTLRLNGVGSSNDVISNKFKFYVGDILYGKLRPYFRKVYHPRFDGVCSTDIYVIKNKSVINQDFLFYIVASDTFTAIAKSGSSGTKMPRAEWSHLAKSVWPIPIQKETQKEVAYILSSLDEKIELNQQMNQTLEAMAQTIFKEWFVNFNFPGFDGELVDGLPKAWKATTLGEMVVVKGGTTPSTVIEEYWNGEFFWTTPKDLSNNKSMVLLDTERKITADGLKQISSGVLPAGTLLLSSRAPIGYLAVAQMPISINQGYIAIQGNLVSNLFMLFWLKQNMDAVKGRANGSTFQEISKSDFREIEAILPEKVVLEAFDNIINPIFERIIANERGNNTLIKLRDNLLPKLMTGKIEVKAKLFI